MSKVRNNERGRGGVERRLVALGASPRQEREPGRGWLEEALHTVGARAVSHGGNHRYAAYIGRRAPAVGSPPPPTRTRRPTKGSRMTAAPPPVATASLWSSTGGWAWTRPRSW